jgi:C-terminal processing protease CtpA/Prc
MKNFFSIQLLTLTLLLAFSSCDKSDYTTTENDEINKFIWQGLNGYYLWQSEVPDLADSRFSTFEQLYSYLGGIGSPSEVFESLLNRPTDRFSWIVDDYVALENAFQGITLNNGMEYGLVRFASTPSNVFGYVRYVVPNSSADTNGVTRGMLFNTIDGTQLTDSNFRSLLSSTNYSIGLADYNLGNPSLNGNSIALTKTQIQENPLAITKVLNEGANHKIGYLLYNQFASSFDGELNAAFASLKSQQVTDLIVDLRYNPGGSVETATYLGAMITGQFNGQIYSKQVWNSKAQAAFDPADFENRFTNQITSGSLNEPINNLNLSRVYFIVTGNSASASELVINALSAHIDVKLVGTTTVGKDEGSITIYDSDDLRRNGANLNQNHAYALQPIVLKIANKNGESKPEGFTPEVFIEEDYGDLGTLGERSDPLLGRTISYIINGSRGRFSSSFAKFNEISNSKLANPTGNNMYVELKKKSVKKSKMVFKTN